jgi:hypothetical protein
VGTGGPLPADQARFHRYALSFSLLSLTVTVFELITCP